MKSTYNTKNNFDIYLEDRSIPDPDILLGRSLKYLKNLGKNVSLLGFDSNSTPFVMIDNIPYSFEKYFGTWEHAHFTKVSIYTHLINILNRKNKIESYMH